MDMIADRMVATRRETWEDPLPDGSPLRRTLGLGFLGGATLDTEESYLLTKFFTAAGAVSVENQARIGRRAHPVSLRTALRSKRQQRRVRQFASNRFHRACVTRRRSRA